MQKRKVDPQAMTTLVLGLAVVCVAVTPDLALAGTGGAELDDVWVTISDWTQGTLGRIISGLMIVAGLAAGVLRGSLGGFISGVGAGIGLYNTPAVLEGVVSATLPVVLGVPMS
jgi:conjugal transfer pilus assembly protein TraA